MSTCGQFPKYPQHKVPSPLLPCCMFCGAVLVPPSEARLGDWVADPLNLKWNAGVVGWSWGSCGWAQHFWWWCHCVIDTASTWNCYNLVLISPHLVVCRVRVRVRIMLPRPHNTTCIIFVDDTSVSIPRCLRADNTILNYLHSIKIGYPVSGGIRASLPYILIGLETVSR